MANSFIRNVETGTTQIVDLLSEEWAKLKSALTADGKFPLWEQTGAHDADPEHHASVEEVNSRARWDVEPLSDVTADGVGQSAKSATSGSRVDAKARDEAKAKPAQSKPKE